MWLRYLLKKYCASVGRVLIFPRISIKVFPGSLALDDAISLLLVPLKMPDILQHMPIDELRYIFAKFQFVLDIILVLP